MLDGSYLLLAKYDLLLRTKPSDLFGQDVRVTISTTRDSVAKKIEPTAVQQCTSVRGFERVVVEKYAQNIRCVDSEELESGHVRPIIVKDGTYTILWGLDVPDDESEQYITSPVVAANCLLNQLFQRRANATSETPQVDFELWTGGAMQKFSNRPLKAVVAEARTNVSHHLKDKTPLQFVYDFCSVDADFESLEFVLDAGRRPL